VNVVKLSYYVEGNDGSPQATDILAESNTIPVVALTNGSGNAITIDDFNYSAQDNQYTLTFSGLIDDPYLSIRPDTTAARPANINVKLNGSVVTTVPITYGQKQRLTGAFKQYRINATFQGSVTVPQAKGPFELLFETDANAFGNKGHAWVIGEITQASAPIDPATNQPQYPTPDSSVLPDLDGQVTDPRPITNRILPDFLLVEPDPSSLGLAWVATDQQLVAPQGPFNPIVMALEGPSDIMSTLKPVIDGKDYALKQMSFSPPRYYIIDADSPDVPKPVVVTPSDKINDADAQKNEAAPLTVDIKGKVDNTTKLEKKSQSAVSVTPGVSFIGTTISNTVNVLLGNLTVTGGTVSGADVQANAFAAAGNNYTFNLASAGTAAVGIRDLTLNVTVNGAAKTAKLKGALTVARIVVKNVKFKDTNEVMYTDQSESQNDSYWMADSQIVTQVWPNQTPKLLPMAFTGHAPPNGTMPKPTADVIIQSEPELTFSTPITLTGTWGISDPAVSLSGSFTLNERNNTQTLVASAALPETTPKKVQADIKWGATIGTGTDVSPVADSKLGPCYFLWASPIWTGKQNDTDGRKTRLASNQMTVHRLDAIFGAINGKTTTDDIISALHAYVNGIKNKSGATTRLSDWRALSGNYLLQCGERSDLLERMLVMIGIDAKHVHAFIPSTDWRTAEPQLGLNFPCAVQAYGIQYHDSIGDNEGEGCVVIPNTSIQNPDTAVNFSSNGSVKRKYVFGRYYAMFSDLTADDAEDYDAQKGVTGAYKILLRLASANDLWAIEGVSRKQYTGWTKLGGFPKP
jgi:hypothetical protein